MVRKRLSKHDQENETYRTLVIKYRKDKIKDKELLQYLENLLKRIEALNNLLSRGYYVVPPDLPKKWVQEQIFFVYNGEPIFYYYPKKWLCHVHAHVNVVIPEIDGYDNGAILCISLRNRELRIRGFGNRKSLKLKISDNVVKYINDRLREGGKHKCGFVWMDDKFLYVAIVFGKKVTYVENVDNIIVVDLNVFWNGVTVGYVENGRIIICRLPENIGELISKIERIYETGNIQFKIYGTLKRLGYHRSIHGKRVWKNVKMCRRRIYAIARDIANKVAHEIIKLALERNAKIIADDPEWESLEELSQKYHGLYSILTKIFTKRVLTILETQAKWYGIPFELKRLPSTICPYCGHELIHVGNRVMKCNNCGFIANRDEIPIHWALKQYDTFHR